MPHYCSYCAAFALSHFHRGRIPRRSLLRDCLSQMSLSQLSRHFTRRSLRGVDALRQIGPHVAVVSEDAPRLTGLFTLMAGLRVAGVMFDPMAGELFGLEKGLYLVDPEISSRVELISAASPLCLVQALQTLRQGGVVFFAVNSKADARNLRTHAKEGPPILPRAPIHVAKAGGVPIVMQRAHVSGRLRIKIDFQHRVWSPPDQPSPENLLREFEVFAAPELGPESSRTFGS